MSISTGGWLTLILGAIVLYGGLLLCLVIAIRKRHHLWPGEECGPRSVSTSSEATDRENSP